MASEHLSRRRRRLRIWLGIGLSLILVGGVALGPVAQRTGVTPAHSLQDYVLGAFVAVLATLWALFAGEMRQWSAAIGPLVLCLAALVLGGLITLIAGLSLWLEGKRAGPAQAGERS